MSEGMSGGTYPNRKWVEVEGGQEDREISGEAMATILRLTQAHTEAVRVAAEYQERAEAYARLIDRLVTELDAWKASPDSLSHRAHWIHPDDHAALAAELERVTAALRETEDDALSLLDQHISTEVRQETGLRIIERIQARDAALAGGARAAQEPSDG
jgi:hypothetical protein